MIQNSAWHKVALSKYLLNEWMKEWVSKWMSFFVDVHIFLRRTGIMSYINFYILRAFIFFSKVLTTRLVTVLFYKTRFVYVRVELKCSSSSHLYYSPSTPLPKSLLIPYLHKSFGGVWKWDGNSRSLAWGVASSVTVLWAMQNICSLHQGL